MLELRPVCENCGKPLPNGSSEAMICSLDCTYCKDCVDNVLYNVCQTCGGGFEKRPTRTKKWLEKYPVTIDPYINPVDPEKHKIMLAKFKDVEPDKRNK